MSRITIDVLERQAEAMGLKVLESDIPGTTCGLYCDRLRTIWLADWLNGRGSAPYAMSLCTRSTVILAAARGSARSASVGRDARRR